MVVGKLIMARNDEGGVTAGLVTRIYPHLLGLHVKCAPSKTS